MSVVFLFFSNVLYAQEKRIEGTVINEAGHPVADALVSVVSSRYNYTVGQAVTDSLGHFAMFIGDIDTEATVITVGHISYELYAQPFSLPAGPMRISLKETVFKMDEVVVLGKPNPISFDKGELIVDVSKVKNYERLNTDQLLNRLPGISVSDNAVSLYGTPVTVYINGVKQMMGTDAILKYISALPAKALSTIKVIPLPTGKYGSDVGAVIDINMNRDMPEGYFSQSEIKGGLTGKDLAVMERVSFL
nr:TonB-dependent receptor [Odoribacter sp. OF09-27XD]